jgi:ribosome-binding factor A
MQGSRQVRVASDLKKRLTEILAGCSHDLPLCKASRVSITDVKVSGDLRAASVKIALGFSLEGSLTPTPQEVLKELKNHTAYMHKKLAPLITFKSVPSLTFQLDDGGDFAKLQEFFNALPDTLRGIEEIKSEE